MYLEVFCKTFDISILSSLALHVSLVTFRLRDTNPASLFVFLRFTLHEMRDTRPFN